jgi:hypothetical protein
VAFSLLKNAFTHIHGAKDTTLLIWGTESGFDRPGQHIWFGFAPRRAGVHWRGMAADRSVHRGAQFVRQWRLLRMLEGATRGMTAAQLKDVRLEVQEWVNKSSGRGSLRLFLQEDLARQTGRAKTIEEWPFVMFPGVRYEDALRWLFPWAELQVDLDSYEPYDEAKHDETCGVWDSEDGCYIMHEPGFSEWRDGLPKFRPYEIVADEVAMYRFEFSLNKVGRAFLLLDGYLNSGAGPDSGTDD